MSDDLVISKPNELVKPSKYATETAIAELGSGTEYIPYIQLMGSSSSIVKQGKFPVGHFSCVKGKERIDLGEKFDAVILGMRPHAMQFGEDFVSVYNPENPEFIRIKKAAQNKQQGFSFGLEFLLYMQEFDEVGCYLFGNPSHQLEAPNVVTIFEKQNSINEYVLAEFVSYLVPPNKKGHSWHVPQVRESESAITKMIDADRLGPIQEKFNNPPESEVETVDEDTRDM